MPPIINLVLLLAGAYLLGSIPFGVLVARSRGVDLLKVGSGNIGATNVGRTLGRKWGILVFVLDLLKGAVPVYLGKWLVLHDAEFVAWQPIPQLAAVGAAVCAFLGHTFPIFLKFQGGKGVATGFGTMLVLLTGPDFFAILIWVVALLASSIVSFASVVAMIAFMAGYTISVDGRPFAFENILTSLYCYIGCSMVIVKHHANIRRLLAGTENCMKPSFRRERINYAFHLLALGWLFGGTLFLQFIAGLSVFETFPDVVENSPSDRTAQVAIANGLSAEQKKALGSALAGAAVGPMFPKYFLCSAIAATVALISARGWRSKEKLNRIQLGLLVVTFLLVCGNWWIAGEVSRLRLERFAADAETAARAKENFTSWHLVSLLLSMLTCLTATISLICAAWTAPEKAQMDVGQLPKAA